jgi:putative ABC transport system permease protein
VVFRPGSLLTRPHTFVGGVKGPGDVTARARLQNGFMERYPGVTFVDALDDIAEIRSRVRDVSRAVSLLGAFVFICGVAILIGSVAMTKMHRLYEAAILKTIGAKRRVLIVITFVEYAVLGALAGTIGSVASIAVTYALSTFGNRPLPWEFHPWITVAGAAGTTMLVILVGVLSTWDVIARKPLGILKEQG